MNLLKPSLRSVLLSLLIGQIGWASAQGSGETYWWNNTVFYEIFVRSFYDSDNDGIGDFKGIIEKLDYLNDGDPETTTDLGIEGIWLMPIHNSPSYHGYDVTDYYSINPDYGTLEDFKAFVDSAHARGIKVIIDFVMNHSSSEHPWFLDARSDPSSPYRNYYRWEDTHPGYNGPWGQPVWHDNGDDFYYGLFWGGMPDINYAEPAVKDSIFDAARFWLDSMQVDGFRLDAIKYIFEEGSTLENVDETYTFLEEFNSVYKAGNPETITVGEVWDNTGVIIPYIQEDRIDICFEFDLSYAIIGAINGSSATGLYGKLASIEADYPFLQYATFLTNHDQDRIFTQLGQSESKAKMAATILMTLPGVPFIYYGEEVGMTGAGDHLNIRRPMQWESGFNAGFSGGPPWLGLGSNYTTNNVADMATDENSLWNWYRKLTNLRSREAALQTGTYEELEASNNGIFSFIRKSEEEVFIVICNLASVPQNNIQFNLEASDINPGTYWADDMLFDRNLEPLTVESGGSITDWTPVPTMDARSAYVLKLSAVTALSTPSREEALKIFPNPAKAFTLLEWIGEAAGEDRVLELADVSGRTIFRENWPAAENRYRLELSDIPAGSYILRIQQGASIISRQLFVAE